MFFSRSQRTVADLVRFVTPTPKTQEKPDVNVYGKVRHVVSECCAIPVEKLSRETRFADIF